MEEHNNQNKRLRNFLATWFLLVILSAIIAAVSGGWQLMVLTMLVFISNIVLFEFLRERQEALLRIKLDGELK